MNRIFIFSLAFLLFSSPSQAINVDDFLPVALFSFFASPEDGEKTVEDIFESFVSSTSLSKITGEEQQKTSIESISKEISQTRDIIRKNIQRKDGLILLPLQYKYPVDDIERVLLISDADKSYIREVFFLSKYKMSVQDVYEIYGRENAKVEKNKDLSINIEYTYDKYNVDTYDLQFFLLLFLINDTKNNVIFNFKSKDNVFIDKVTTTFFMPESRGL